MHGWNPRQMVDVVHDDADKVQDSISWNDNTEFLAVVSSHVAKLKRVHEEVFPDANNNIKSAQKRQKMTYDRIHDKHSTFKVGEKVLLHNLRRVSRKGGKHKDVWDGPYTIVKVRMNKNNCHAL